MTYIVLSVLASSAILLIFRWFSSAGINSRHAIMTNYAVASATGLIVFTPSAHWYNQPWFWPSAALGILFYTIFRVMAKTAQENGVAVGVVVTKMSVIIPVIIGLTVLNEGANWFKIVGIICGLAAVFLTTNGHIKGGAIIWPAVLFVGSGIIDTLLNLFQEWSVTEDEFPVFSSTVFAFAFLIALSTLTLTEKLTSKVTSLPDILSPSPTFAVAILDVPCCPKPNPTLAPIECDCP